MSVSLHLRVKDSCWDCMAEVSKALEFETEIRSFELSVLFASSRLRVKLFLSPRSRAKTLSREDLRMKPLVKRLTQISSFHSSGKAPEICVLRALPWRRPVVLLPGHL